MSGSETTELLPEGETLRVNEWGQSVLWLLAGGAILLGLFLLLVGPSANGQLRGPLRPVLGLAWIGFGAMMAMASRSGLILSEDGITVQGVIRRRRWRWDEVKAFEIAPAIYAPLLRVSLADGRHVRVPGFKARSEAERRVARERVAALNQRASG